MIRHSIFSFFYKSFIFLIIFLVHSNTYCFSQNFSPNLPQADLDFMNSPEFADMMGEFERELAALSPEERASFDEMMNEFARVIQEMPEEEFNQLLEDIGNDMQMADDMGLLDATESTHVDVAPAVDIAAPVAKVEIPDEIKELAELLQITKTYLALFLSKMQIAPDLPLKIDKWMRNEKITGIPSEYTWLQCTEDIEAFISLLSAMLETDAKSNPIFLFEIHKDTTLEQMLRELSLLLSEVPTLSVVEFGTKQERETNEQIQRIISELCSIMLQKNAIQKLQTLSQQKQPRETITKQEITETEQSPIITESPVERGEFGRFEESEDQDEIFDFE